MINGSKPNRICILSDVNCIFTIEGFINLFIKLQQRFLKFLSLFSITINPTYDHMMISLHSLRGGILSLEDKTDFKGFKDVILFDYPFIGVSDSQQYT